MDNRERDNVARRAGWFVIRIWEHDILSNVTRAAARVTAKFKELRGRR